MAMLSTLIKLSLLAAATVKALPTAETSPANPLVRRTTVLPYNEIVGFPQTVPDDTEGELYTAYQPYLYVYNGCVPFPAVDAEGDVRSVACKTLIFFTNGNWLGGFSGGLPITGFDGNTDCTSSTGQVYGRAAAYGDYYAIMYAWYVQAFFLSKRII